jgi:hypothetical protein
VDPAYLPAELMAKFAGLATDREVSEAAAYFSSRALRRPRAQVIEADRVPRIHAEAWVYVTPGGGGNEPLGVRLIELPRDFARHELRDSQVEYVAYVPLGSIERGRKLAMDADLVRPPLCELPWRRPARRRAGAAHRRAVADLPAAPAGRLQDRRADEARRRSARPEGHDRGGGVRRLGSAMKARVACRAGSRAYLPAPSIPAWRSSSTMEVAASSGGVFAAST